MPDFGTATVVETLSRISASFVGSAGRRTTTIGNEYATGDVTLAEVSAWAAALGQLSNAGLYRHTGIGVVREIALSNAIIADELHGIDRSLVMVFQKGDTLDVARFKIPAPDAALFIGRYQMKSPTDPVQGTRITNAVNAYLAIINEDNPSPGTAWQLVNGYLDNAPSAVRELYPDESNYFEPPAGTAGDDPGETPV